MIKNKLKVIFKLMVILLVCVAIAYYTINKTKT